MSIKKTIKVILAENDTTLTKVVDKLNKKNENEENFKKDSLQNLSKKINKGTLRYEEAEEIACVLGYKIEWVKKESRD